MRNPLGLFSKVFAGEAAETEREELAAFETGWDSSYSTPGSGFRPRRKVFNDLFAKLFAVCFDVNKYGAGLPWNTNISYGQYAVSTGSNGRLYLSNEADNAGHDPISSPTQWSVIPTAADIADKSDKSAEAYNVTVAVEDEDRVIDASNLDDISLEKVALVLATLVKDLKAKGDFQ
jgi:hypothetical protein